MKQIFIEEQIINILQEGQGGITVNALCRSYAIAPATYYRWKNKIYAAKTSGSMARVAPTRS